MNSLVKKLVCCGAKSLFPSSELPKGYIHVYVGKEALCKLVLEANYLNHPLLENLLQLSVEEYGYSYNGALRIACEADLFMHLINLLKSRNPSVHYMDLQDLISNFSTNTAKQKHLQ